MSKFLHDDAGPKCGAAARRLGIKWPPLPWRCPICGERFTSHAETVATIDLGRYKYPDEATFCCVFCDLATFAQPSKAQR